MDYKKIYDNLMNDTLNKKPERILLKKTGIYFEGHHIIPKSKGGTGNSNRPKNNPNIVLLTPREHFLSHWLLWKIYRDRQTALAFHKMMSTNDKQKRITSSRGYEEAREAFRITNLGNQYGKGVKKIVTEEQRKKHSIVMKGRFIGDLNPSKRPEVRKKISSKLKGVKKSNEHINKMRDNMKNQEKIVCPFCGKSNDKLNSKKWHFDYCKLNPNHKERPTSSIVEYNMKTCKKIIDLKTNVIYNTITEASKSLNVSHQTIVKWAKKGNKIKFHV